MNPSLYFDLSRINIMFVCNVKLGVALGNVAMQRLYLSLESVPVMTDQYEHCDIDH